jgi:hydroxymethylglutaryl-CoA lyase
LSHDPSLNYRHRVYAACQFHDTFGIEVANSMAALSAGIRTIDSSIGGLGPLGIPFPGATGNVAREDVLYALRDPRYSAPGDIDALVDVAFKFWISDMLRRDDSSRVAKAIHTRRERGVEL